MSLNGDVARENESQDPSRLSVQSIAKIVGQDAAATRWHSNTKPHREKVDF